MIDLLPEETVTPLGLDPEVLAQIVADNDLNVFYGEGLYPRQVIVVDQRDYFGFSIIGQYPALAARFFGPWDLIQQFPNETLVVALGCGKQVEDKDYQDIVMFYLPDYDTAYYSGSDWRTMCPLTP